MKNNPHAGNSIIGTIVSIAYALVMAIVGLRFLFALLGANQYNNFVSTIYAYSDPLIDPFRGIFTQPVTPGSGQFDVAALVALVVYGLVGGLLTGAAGRSHN